MDKNKTHKGKQPEAQQENVAEEQAPEVMDVLDECEGDSEETAEALSDNATLQNELEEARAEIEKEKKEYLFLMAREKAELMKNAGERVLLGILPIVDDFERGLAATADSGNADAVRQGMELIYNKLIKYLESNGVKAMESTGADFDADFHEAIATIPAPSEDLKGKVIDTTQKGYMINDKVLRHAKVAVGE